MSTSRPTPLGPARRDQEGIARLLNRFPDRTQSALTGDRGALVDLLTIAADVEWQSRAEILGTLDSVAAEAHALANATAELHAAERAPSDVIVERSSDLADRVDALAIELELRRRVAGDSDLAELGRVDPERVSLRFQARSHLTAMRNAERVERVVSHADVLAAEHLYDLIVEHTRYATERVVFRSLNALAGDRSSISAAPVAPDQPDESDER